MDDHHVLRHTEHQTLCLYMVEPDSRAAESLRLVSSWNTTEAGRTPDHRAAGF